MSTAGDIAHVHHAIDSVEIAVTDIDAAKAFYASAFGWSLVDCGPDSPGIQGDGGRRFHFADPAGNELAVWSDRSATA